MRTYTHENGRTYNIVPAIDVCHGCAFTNPIKFCVKGNGLNGEYFDCTQVIAIDPAKHDEYIAARVAYRLEQAHSK